MSWKAAPSSPAVVEVPVVEDRYCVVFITVEDRQEGERIADRLLAAKLAACVNQLTGVSSRFWWEGQIDSAAESLLVVKTKRTALAELERVVQQAHSYDVPEIIALPIVWGSSSYLDWIDEQVDA